MVFPSCTQEATIPSPVPMETAATGSTHDLECSHSERSIDEAIERTRSSETLSPTSPAHMMDGKWIDQCDVSETQTLVHNSTYYICTCLDILTTQCNSSLFR